MAYRPLRKPPAGAARSGRPRRDGPTATVAGVVVTDPDRMVFRPLGLTKRQLAQYYETIASWALPHMAGRPTTVVRCPVATPCYFEVHRKGWAPPGVHTVPIAEKEKVGEYAVVRRVQDLVRLVEADVREIHTWNSCWPDVERPDRLVFDLDPGDGVDPEAETRALFEMRERLGALGLDSFVKTTGGHGFHVVVPVEQPGWNEGLSFARTFVQAMANDSPDRYTADMSKAVRSGRIYLDYLRNARGATSIAAFSTRASIHGRVSVPIGWDELRRGQPQLSVPELLARLLRSEPDPWADYFTRRQRLPASAAPSKRRPVRANAK
jgi:bifunctional non-homologous end joining protein LigD